MNLSYFAIRNFERAFPKYNKIRLLAARNSAANAFIKVVVRLKRKTRSLCLREGRAYKTSVQVKQSHRRAKRQCDHVFVCSDSKELTILYYKCLCIISAGIGINFSVVINLFQIIPSKKLHHTFYDFTFCPAVISSFVCCVIKSPNFFRAFIITLLC